MGRSLFSYWLNAVDDHSLQAPFIYDFYLNVVKKKPLDAPIAPIKQLRRNLIRNQTIIPVIDYGAGTNDTPGRTISRTISSIARKSHQPAVSRVLFNTCVKFKPKVIVELGTSVGLSTLYMATAAPQANIITIEGCPKISQLANRHFEQLNISNIELVSGDLNQTLPKVLSRLESIDLLFIDANHRFKPTIEYFMRCLPKFNEETVVILDDIHWSLGMERAWESLKNHPRVRLTADLFCAGILFFRSNLSKSHHILAW